MKFEVPYNFDKLLISYYQKNSSYINYLYLPPYKEDSINSRTSIQTTNVGHCYMPTSREEYESHLKAIKNAGLDFVILWQVYGNIISQQVLDYYCGLGASGFIVANDTNAKLIKQYSPSLLSICSIVQRTSANIVKKDLSCYDYVILYYNFNRALDALKLLAPIKSKIILMPNTLCNMDCPSVHHWFPTEKRPFVPNRDCPMKEGNINKCGLIFPEHLEMFDEHVGGYKLQGREYPTPAIKYLCHFYFKRTYYYDFIEPFIKKTMSSELRRLVENTPLDKYYNVNTQNILSEWQEMSLNP